jgi:hypothetical protein
MKLFFIVAALATSTLSFAQDATKKDQMEEVKEKKEITSQKPNEEYTRVVVDESRMNRDNVKYMVTGTLSAQMVHSSASGFTFGFYKEPNNIVFASFYTLEYNDFNFHDEELDDGSLFELGIQHFTGNSFYIKPTIYLRNQQLGDDEEYDSGSSSYKLTDITDYKTVGIGFSIGNQWQWENFTIGCNWIGIKKDLSTLDKDGPGTDAYYEVTSELLNFYLGASF